MGVRFQEEISSEQVCSSLHAFSSLKSMKSQKITQQTFEWLSEMGHFFSALFYSLVESINWYNSSLMHNYNNYFYYFLCKEIRFDLKDETKKKNSHQQRKCSANAVHQTPHFGSCFSSFGNSKSNFFGIYTEKKKKKKIYAFFLCFMHPWTIIFFA